MQLYHHRILTELNKVSNDLTTESTVKMRKRHNDDHDEDDGDNDGDNENSDGDGRDDCTRMTTTATSH
ncbi:unnamed protein product [Dracunculus medinensis]|uniref:Uncharacterized protein n=1 Tax=Dracunculus medinensis TaxID=318479 RepID=A0A0N4U4M7_DRAME|nr:unnamed protein product [Dracunculus medinensis]